MCMSGQDPRNRPNRPNTLPPDPPKTSSNDIEKSMDFEVGGGPVGRLQGPQRAKLVLHILACKIVSNVFSALISGTACIARRTPRI